MSLMRRKMVFALVGILALLFPPVLIHPAKIFELGSIRFCWLFSSNTFSSVDQIVAPVLLGELFILYVLLFPGDRAIRHPQTDE